MIEKNYSADNNERIGRLETSVESFHEEIGEVRGTLKDIVRMLNRSKETNWGVILAGVAIAGSIYAAAIRPLEKEIERQERGALEIARAVVVAGEKTSQADNQIVRLNADLTVAKERLERIYNFGSPVADKRMTLLEWRLEHAEK